MQGPHNQLQLQLAHLLVRPGMSPCFLKLKSDYYAVLYAVCTVCAKADPIRTLITVLYSCRAILSCPPCCWGLHVHVHDPTRFYSCDCRQVPATNPTSNPAPNPAPAPNPDPTPALDLVTAQTPMTQRHTIPITVHMYNLWHYLQWLLYVPPHPTVPLLDASCLSSSTLFTSPPLPWIPCHSHPLPPVPVQICEQD